METKGYGASLIDDGKTITIHREGLAGRLNGFGDVTFPIESLESITFRSATFSSNGHVRFNVVGGPAFDGKAATDGYAVIFTYQQRKQFQALRDDLESRISTYPAPAVDIPQQGTWQRVSERLETAEQAAQQREARLVRKFGPWRVDGETVYGPKGHGPLAGARAEAAAGQDVQRMSLGRVAGGAILAGGVGAILGGMAKKTSHGKGVLVVAFSDGRTLSSEFASSDLQEALRFAAMVNQLAQRA